MTCGPCAHKVTTNPELAARQLNELKQMTMQSLDELRDLIGTLSPSLLEDLGRVAALQPGPPT